MAESSVDAVSMERTVTMSRPDPPEENSAAEQQPQQHSPHQPAPQGPEASEGEAPEDQEEAAAVDDNKKDVETLTEGTAESAAEENKRRATSTKQPVVSSNKKSRPPYKYDPNKVTIRFLFANRDGLTVTLECEPSDTVGEVKGALLSVWPKDLPNCSGGDYLRLVCMGKGYLMPDSRTLEECQIPVFKSHPTPVNVTVRPEVDAAEDLKKKSDSLFGGGSRAADSSADGGATSQGCACSIL